MGSKRKSVSGPPPHFQKWLDEHRRGMHQGRTPTPEHSTSIWDTSFIPNHCTPATSELIAEAELRLGIKIPKCMKDQLLIQNGGCLFECDLFKDSSIHWTNATVDGIDQVQSWRRAEDDHWFESIADVKKIDQLIVIAAHSESKLCLDYRKSGSKGMPCVAFVDVSMKPTQVTLIAKTAEKFIHAIIASRPAKDA